MAGIASAQSPAAQSGPIALGTTGASGNLATDGGAIRSAITALDGRVTTNEAEIVVLGAGLAATDARVGALEAGVGGHAAEVGQNREGIAMALAMDVPYVPSGKRFAPSSALGHFSGETGLAVNGAWRLGAGPSPLRRGPKVPPFPTRPRPPPWSGRR